MSMGWYKRKLAVFLTAVMVLEPVIQVLPAMASGQTVMEIAEFKELDESVMVQTVPYGTAYEDLDLPGYLSAQVCEVTVDEDEDEEAASVSDATSSNVLSSAATLSDAPGKETSEEEDGYRMIPVSWELNSGPGGLSDYDGETAGTYVFDAVLAADGYRLGEAILPFIEVEVLEEEPLEAFEITDTVEMVLADLWDFSSNQEMLNAYVEQILYGEAGISLMADYGEDVLSGNEYALYSILKTAVKQIAALERTSTQIELSDTDVCWSWTWDELGVSYSDGWEIIQPAVDTAYAETEFDRSKV